MSQVRNLARLLCSLSQFAKTGLLLRSPTEHHKRCNNWLPVSSLFGKQRTKLPTSWLDCRMTVSSTFVTGSTYRGTILFLPCRQILHMGKFRSLGVCTLGWNGHLKPLQRQSDKQFYARDGQYLSGCAKMICHASFDRNPCCYVMCIRDIKAALKAKTPCSSAARG